MRKNQEIKKYIIKQGHEEYANMDDEEMCWSL